MIDFKRCEDCPFSGTVFCRLIEKCPKKDDKQNGGDSDGRP